MNYPRIYSLTTVGILKHYIQDYLFHPLRTDFIGANGVGKSIIADLLQLLFVYDSDMIKFGTDGINQAERSIYTLPYLTNIAYCFLNIEIEKGKYLIIGIGISAQKGTRITPFVITKSPELEKGINELSFSKDEILLSKSFTKDNAIPDLKILASKLIQDQGLYISMFKTKDEVKRYYQFLFEKQILSINLAVEENLKAFSKVIQSFSKAKALNLNASSASKSLKEFLFEDSDTELLNEYENQKHLLEKILREYGSLNSYIKNLEQKQQNLIQLKKFDIECKEKFRLFKTAQINIVYFDLQQIKIHESEIKDTLESERKNKYSFEKNISRIPALESKIEKSLHKADENFDCYNEYQSKKDEFDKLNSEIINLNNLNLPAINLDWQEGVGIIDISSQPTNQIIELIQFATPYLNKYQTLQNIEAIYKSQYDDLLQLIQELQEEKITCEKFISILDGNSEESVIGYAINKKLSLNFEQKSLLINYATLPIIKPSSPQKKERYISVDELLNNLNIEVDKSNNGFWIKFGAINEFIEFDENAELFENPQIFSQSINNLLLKQKNKLELLLKKEREIENIRKGKPYDGGLIHKNYEYSFFSYHTIEKIKEALGYILCLEEKLDALRNQKQLIEVKLVEIESKMPSNLNYDEPELIKKKLREIRDLQIKRTTKIAAYSAEQREKLQQTENKIKECDGKLIDVTRNILERYKELQQLNTKYFEIFGENLNDYFSESRDLEDIKKDFEDAQRKYQVKYYDIINQFNETKNQNNIPVNIELKNETFSFRVLEEALLGAKIKFTDDIGAALEQANSGRLNMADDIKNNMIKVFDRTLKRYKQYKELVQSINTFFKGIKISERFYFKIDFSENNTLKIDFVEDIGEKMRYAARQGELAFDRPVSDFIEEFFRKAAGMTSRVEIEKLLNPKTYFDLSVSLTDENNIEIPGSTGETYSAIALLGIARLSFVQTQKRKGLRFIILEEIGSLDNSNFNTFPAIAKEFGYQIVTMSPHPFRTTLADEWYAHHLIKGNIDKNINFYPSASYFKTKDLSEDLNTYLSRLKNELDSFKSIA